MTLARFNRLATVAYADGARCRGKGIAAKGNRLYTDAQRKLATRKVNGFAYVSADDGDGPELVSFWFDGYNDLAHAISDGTARINYRTNAYAL
jgi:hypothetical protein